MLNSVGKRFCLCFCMSEVISSFRMEVVTSFPVVSSWVIFLV